MAKRQIGDAIIRINFVGGTRDEYQGSVSAGGKVWHFDSLYAPACGFPFGYDSPAAYDKMAKSAVSFGGYYTSHNRGDDTPDWAPAPEVADAIDNASAFAMNDSGDYEVTRIR